MPDSSLPSLSFFDAYWPRAEPPGCTTQKESWGLGVQGTWCLHQTRQVLGPKHAGAPGMLAHRSFLPVWRLSTGAGGSPCCSLCCPSSRTPPCSLGGTMQALVSPVTKAIFVALFLFAILLILYVNLWYTSRDLDNDPILSR